MRFINKIFKTNTKNDDDEIYRILLPSILAICLCAVCLMGSTFAWFTATSETKSQSIKFASYDADVYVSSETGLVDLTALSAGEYKITINASGTASNGYCVLRFNGDVNTDIHTIPVKPNETLELTLTIESDSDVCLEIVPTWGQSSKESESWISTQSGYTYTG